MTIYLFLGHNRREGVRIHEQIKASSGNIFEIQDRIDSGGNAVVHRCQHTITGDSYAIKFQLSNSEKMRNRFTQEIQLLKQIKHEQLIEYYDDGEVEGLNYKKVSINLKYLIMELADNNLYNYLDHIQPNIQYAEYIGQFKGLALALATLHEMAIHRDIKPENILINGGTWLLSDFGLCKYNEDEDAPDLTSVNEKIGPKFWMSPEALNRTIGNTDDISKQSDVYQLCSIYWYVVTGRNPAGMVCREDWKGPSHLFDVIFNSLSHDPNKRPKDGKELYDLLEKVTLDEAFSGV